MKIQTKILGILGIFLLATVLSVLIYSSYSLRITRIQSEEHYLNEIEEQLWKELSLISEIPYNPLNTQEKNYIEFLKNRVAISKQMSRLKYLSEANETIKKSLENMVNLDNLIVERRESFLESLSNLTDVLDNIFISGDTSFSQLTYDSRLLKYERFNYYLLKWTQFNSNISALLNTVTTSLEQIRSQSETIRLEISRLRIRALIASFSFIVPIMLIALFLVLRVMKSIKKSIGGMQNSLNLFIEGDLTRPITSNSRDELGMLSREMDKYRETLKKSLDHIKSVSHENMETKNSLIKSVSQTNNSLDNVNNSITAIGSSSNHLNESMHNAVNAVKATFKLVDNFGNQINSQYGMVEETSSAITEIISSVESIAQMTESSQSSVKHLVNTAQDGSSKLGETRNVIKEINGAIESILAMVEIIDNISTQTDLLSINAAIEAAHAGEAGQGFSIVAEEIGKLAVNASEGTHEMSMEINRIVEMIRNAGVSSEMTSASFDEISSGIEQVNQVFSEIHLAINELKLGGQQIQDTTVQLREFSAEVDNMAKDISGNTEKVMVEVNQVGRVTEEVKQESSQIMNNMEMIIEKMNLVKSDSFDIEKSSESMSTILSYFKTEEDES